MLKIRKPEKIVFQGWGYTLENMFKPASSTLGMASRANFSLGNINEAAEKIAKIAY